MAPKPCIHVGIIGHPGHGKTTLTAALARVSAALYGGEAPRAIDHKSAPPADGIQVHGAEVWYESLSRHYVHVDFATATDFLKALVARPAGIDGVLLVVDSRMGVEPDAGEQLALAHAAGIPGAAAFVTQVDRCDPVLVEATADEVRELFQARGYPGAPVLRGSALHALHAVAAGQLRHPEVKAIRRLVQAMDDHIANSPVPHRHEEEPASIIRSKRSRTAAA